MSKTFSTEREQLNDVLLLSDAADPTAGAGVAAPIGSKYWRGTATSGDYTKTGAADTAWTLVPTGIYFNVKDYGATGDGVTDDRANIQRAIDDASVIGGTVYFPPGAYLCGKNGTSSFSITADHIRFLGCGWGGSVIKQSDDAAGGEFHLFEISGGAVATEFELLTFDGSGVTNPGADQCSMIYASEAEIVKVITCRFTGGVAGMGAYVQAGGSVGDPVSLVWITGCDMSGADTCVWFAGGVTSAWLLDNDFATTVAQPAVILDDASGDGLVDIVVSGNYASSLSSSLEVTGTAASERMGISNNVWIGPVVIDGMTKCQFQHNEIYLTQSGIADPVLSVSDCTLSQCQANIIGRMTGADDGLIAEFDTLTQCQVQRNLWVQETEAGLLEIIDAQTSQFSSNLTKATDAGATAHDAYLVRAVARVVENVQFSNEQITADAGEWDNAIHVLRDGANFGAFQITNGVLSDCDVGVLFDDNGTGVGAFTSFLMVAGVLIDATTDAYSVTVAGVFIRIGGNASTFGANIIAGNGDPNGALTARVGSQYMRLDGGAGTSVYIKESGTGNTGWAAK